MFSHLIFDTKIVHILHSLFHHDLLTMFIDARQIILEEARQVTSSVLVFSPMLRKKHLRGDKKLISNFDATSTSNANENTAAFTYRWSSGRESLDRHGRGCHNRFGWEGSAGW